MSSVRTRIIKAVAAKLAQLPVVIDVVDTPGREWSPVPQLANQVGRCVVELFAGADELKMTSLTQLDAFTMPVAVIVHLSAQDAEDDRSQGEYADSVLAAVYGAMRTEQWSDETGALAVDTRCLSKCSGVIIDDRYGTDAAMGIYEVDYRVVIGDAEVAG